MIGQRIICIDVTVNEDSTEETKITLENGHTYIVTEEEE